MVRKLITVKVTHDVLIPIWIAAFGLVVVTNPPLGAAASLGLFVIGVCVLPAAVLMGGAAGWRAQHG